MSTSSIGAYNQLAGAFEKEGWVLDDVTKLKQFNNLKGILDILNGKAVISYPDRVWRIENGVIYFTVTSNGKTGEEWIVYFQAKKITVSDYAKQLLLSPDFKPTTGVTYEIAVLKGELFTDDNRIVKTIRAEADKRGLTKPNAEVACLIRDMFTDAELEVMGLYWIVVMHEPILDSDGDPRLLSAARYGGGCLSADYGKPGYRFDRDSGFAFVVRQVSLAA
ncbi:MAG: hypothetical protein WCO55_04400 [Candidatus Falkowbacteria bacterium]